LRGLGVNVVLDFSGAADVNGAVRGTLLCALRRPRRAPSPACPVSAASSADHCGDQKSLLAVPMLAQAGANYC